MDNNSEHAQLTPWTPTPLSPHAIVPHVGDGLGEPPPPPKMFSPRMAWRATKRHWWQILAIWLFGTAGLGYLAYTKVHPLYDAVAWIQVEPAAKGLIVSTMQSGSDGFTPYLETQVLLITSPNVLAEAIADKSIARLPRIRSSIDPEIDLRKDIAVAPQKGTHLIRVLMSGENSTEVTSIVNAVVKAYLGMAKTWTDTEVRTEIDKLKELQKRYEAEVTRLQAQLKVKMKESNENQVNNFKGNKEGDGQSQGRLTMTWEAYRELRLKQTDIQMERMKVEARVNQYAEEVKNRSALPIAADALPAESLEDAIKDEFQSAPDVMRLTDEIQKIRNKIASIERVARRGGDPAAKVQKKKLDDLTAQHDELWAKMYPSLKRRLSMKPSSANDPVQGSLETALHTAKDQLRDIRIQENFMDERIKNVEVEVQKQNNEVVELRFLENDVQLRRELLTTVTKNLEQLEYEAQNTTRIKAIAYAKATNMPSSNNRLKLLIATPILMLVLAVGLFTLLEAKAARVADPDDLSSRLRLGVIGVVPPLPSLHSSTKALGFRARNDEKRRVEEFVQSLDQLRVTLCAPQVGKSHRRCVLITSATGGEGKTTLAAQLAGRCANAGLMTLLIDADLRRPSLGELLEVPEGPGFVDVLAGEAAPETAMVVIGNAGGFHLLPAGTTGQDPSRLLHSDRLGLLIGQFRETFDMVIIDAPPVLAVPDALLLGRWTDGAVLAVRHDTSRFPLVERANRRLASVGVPVLGAVVNGVRSMESSYGSYRYTPYAAAGAPSDAGTDVAPLE